MKALRRAAWLLFAAGVIGGTLGDRSPAPANLRVGELDVLVADLHVHTFLGDGAFWPWDLATEAQRRGLDVVAFTNHNQTFAARGGRFLAERLGGPMVLVGEEITAPGFHIVALGIESTIDWRQSAAGAIREVHRQGGVAIAAHPVVRMWAGYDDEALAALDGAEIAHPAGQSRDKGEELRSFYDHALSRRAGRPLARIGSSDHHVLSNLGRWRTFLFVRQRTPAGVLDAIRESRTVAQDADGALYGDPALVRLLQPPPAPEPPVGARVRGTGDRLARAAGWWGLLALVVLGREFRAPGISGRPGSPGPGSLRR